MTRLFLGIESSCDDTAAAVVGEDRSILSSVVFNQDDLHGKYGGVVPELAARAHAEKLDLAVERALSTAQKTLDDIDAIAVTAGPGLIGGVVSGVMFARGLAKARRLPLLGVNHLAGHALTPRLTDGLSFPYLMLLVSGGHCQFLIVEGPNHFNRLGGTIDDAPGEAFDKVARMLGLEKSSGPAVEAAASNGDPQRFSFPRPLLNRDGCDLSFSGLKTAVRRARDALVEEKGGLTAQDQNDLCAGFQASVVDVLNEKTSRAIATYKAHSSKSPAIAVAGGVASNEAIREGLALVAEQNEVAFIAPPLPLCTDNAAMIAWAGFEQENISQDFAPRPRWPLDETQAPMLGSGKKGAKA